MMENKILDKINSVENELIKVICKKYNTTQEMAKKIIDTLTIEKPYLNFYGIGLLIVQNECSDEIQKIIKKAGEK